MPESSDRRCETPPIYSPPAQPICDAQGNLWPTPEQFPIAKKATPSQRTKLGYDNDQMPMWLRPRCPCCGCRQLPPAGHSPHLDQQNPCGYDPTDPCDQMLYEEYYQSFSDVCPPHRRYCAQIQRALHTPCCVASCPPVGLPIAGTAQAYMGQCQQSPASGPKSASQPPPTQGQRYGSPNGRWEDCCCEGRSVQPDCERRRQC
ncbi:unnamed protein product [Schistocephalus solidus]|uniref:Uncharacterized protein n=2 Tax=Schistocephalus solidus TaxID=70667 RepID=A0A183TDJ9_SCHSO|nr:unnamed protein product [Schistocephalus solidus]